MKLLEESKMPRSKFTPKAPDVSIGEEVTSMEETYNANEEGLNTEDESSFVPESFNNSPAPVKKVRVKLNCDHTCCFGGEWYYFTKGKMENVPLELKETLLQSGYLMPT